MSNREMTSNAKEYVLKKMYIANSVLTFFFVLLYMYIYSSTVKKLENELRQRAERDHLTGLYNRRKTKQLLKSVIEPEQT